MSSVLDTIRNSKGIKSLCEELNINFNELGVFCDGKEIKKCDTKSIVHIKDGQIVRVELDSGDSFANRMVSRDRITNGQKINIKK